MESPIAPSEPVTLSGGVGDDGEDGDFRQECRKTWARMIKKVYEMDPWICPRCGFPMRVLSCIEDPPVVRRIPEPPGFVGRLQVRPTRPAYADMG